MLWHEQIIKIDRAICKGTARRAPTPGGFISLSINGKGCMKDGKYKTHKK